MTLEEQIKQIIAETLNIELSDVTPNLGINGIPEWNSMGNLAIMSALEEKLNVEIPMEDLFDLTTVQSIIEEIKNIKK